MAGRILLIRHATHDRPDPVLVGRDDSVRLSEKGYKQGQDLAQRLAPLPLSVVITSPSCRCRMTAEIIAAPHGLDLEIEPDLDEIDFGAWRGRTFAELDTDPEWRLFNMARGSARTPGGETIISVSARIERAFNRIRDRSPDQMVAVISHGDVIRAALCWVLGLAPDLMLRFEISPSSVSTIEFGDGAPRLLVLNWIDRYPQGLPN